MVEETEKEPIDWFQLGFMGIAGVLCLALMDYAGMAFVGSSPFPWIHWLGRAIVWLIR